MTNSNELTEKYLASYTNQKREGGKKMDEIEKNMRGLIAERCGGENFDAPGGGYAFSDVLQVISTYLAQRHNVDESGASVHY